jgi:hypothetical protein
VTSPSAEPAGPALEEGDGDGDPRPDEPAPRPAGPALEEGDRDDSPPVEPAPALDERSRRILAFERRWWRRAGAKEQAIRDTFGLSATRYYQLLNRLLDDPAALAHDPVLIGRLRRLRQRRGRPAR